MSKKEQMNEKEQKGKVVNLSGNSKEEQSKDTSFNPENIDKGMEYSLRMIMDLRQNLKIYRGRISFIVNIIRKTKFYRKAQENQSAEHYNSVEATVVNLLLAKGAMGDVLKRLIPSIDLMAYEYWKKILKFRDDENHGKKFFGEFTNDEINDICKEIEEYLPENKNPENVYEADLTDLVNSFFEGYTYPKQESKDVEPALDDIPVKNLNIGITGYEYEDKAGNPVENLSLLTEIQLIDWVKSEIGIAAEGLLQSIPKNITNPIFNILSSGKLQKPFDEKFILLVSLQGAYKSLLDAKNIFGYTFQYYV